MADTPTQSGSHSGSIVSGVAGRYASALFDLARDAGQIDEVAGALDTFSRLIAESEDLARLVRNPIFTADEQTRAVGALLDRAGIGGLTANFIRLVASKRRLFLLPQMIAAFRELHAAHRGIVKAQVTLAERPSDRIMDEIRSAVRDAARAEVDLDVRIDPAIIGGLVVKMGSRMIDASLRTKLNSIRLAMRAAR